MSIEEVAWDLEDAIYSAQAKDPTVVQDPFFQAIVDLLRRANMTVMDRRREMGIRVP